MANRVVVRVHDLAIQSMFAPGGEVYAFGRKLGRETLVTATMLAPKRTGTLAASLGTRTTPIPFGWRTTISASAGHAQYVILGTTGPIRPRYSKMLRLAPGGGYPMLYRRQVRGQRANNFLDEAKRLTMLRNRLL